MNDFTLSQPLEGGVFASATLLAKYLARVEYITSFNARLQRVYAPFMTMHEIHRLFAYPPFPTVYKGVTK